MRFQDVGLTDDPRGSPKDLIKAGRYELVLAEARRVAAY